MTTAPPTPMMLHLSGAPRVALERGALTPLGPAVDRLAATLSARPEGIIVADGRRLDEPRWPIRHDARLAIWSVEQLPHARLEHERATIELARQALDDPDLADALSQAATARGGFTLGAQLAGLPEERLISANIIPTDPTARDAFWDGYRAQLSPEALVQHTLISQLLSACRSGVEGWLAYHAHRRLPSHAAEASYLIAAAVAGELGGGERFWSAWLNVALALAVGPHPRVTSR